MLYCRLIGEAAKAQQATLQLLSNNATHRNNFPVMTLAMLIAGYGTKLDRIFLETTIMIRKDAPGSVD